MKRNREQKNNPALSLIIIASIVLINIFSTLGLVLVAIIGAVAVSIWAFAKGKGQGSRTENEQDGRFERRIYNERHRSARNRPVIGAFGEDGRRRIEELEDLFKAGIIERDEYHERLVQLKSDDGF